MSRVQEVKEGLVGVHNMLKNQQQAAKALLEEADISAWRRVDLKKYANDLKMLGLPAENIVKALGACVNLSETIYQKNRFLVNELNNLRADLVGKVDEQQVISTADKLSRKCLSLEKEASAVCSDIRFLVEARQQLCGSLSLANLFEMARKRVGRSVDKFNDGIEVFEFLVPAGDHDDDKNRLQLLREDGEKITLRLRGINLDGLPEMAGEIVRHQILQAEEAIETVLSFLGYVESCFMADLGSRTLLTQKLAELELEMSIAVVLEETHEIARRMAALLVSLGSKKQLLSYMSQVSRMYESLNVFHLVVKNSLLVNLAGRIEGDLSLNPSMVATKYTSRFFSGFWGLVRSLKLMLCSLRGKQVFDEKELHSILQHAIESNKVFYGKSERDVVQLSSFIEELLCDFERPFPYNHLFKLVKNALGDYGSNVEKYVTNFKIEEKYRDCKNTVIPMKLGTLVKEISDRKLYYRKIVEGAL